MRLALAARRAGESGEPAASLQRSSNVKRDRQQTPDEGRSVFEKALGDIAELKIQLAINDGYGNALIETLKRTYATLEKLEQKRAARESNRRAP
jgi:hypothetical protein